MPIGTYTPPPLAKALHNFFFQIFFLFFFHFRCILLQISHQKCFFISISIPGRSGVNYKLHFIHIFVHFFFKFHNLRNRAVNIIQNSKKVAIVRRTLI